MDRLRLSLRELERIEEEELARAAADTATAEGRVVRLDLAPRDGTYVLSDLSTGPVLFATC